jgi:glucose-6-phosphate 1-epimerase
LDDKQVVKLEKENFPDTVVWNPWIEKAKAMADFGDDEYKEMICVESGYVSQRRFLESGETFSMGQTISL